MEKDTRVVYGAMCSWWDSIDKVSSNDGLPCCPHCGGILFEVPTEEEWFKGVDLYAAKGHPNYRKFIEWLRGKCFKGGHPEAIAVFEKLN